MSINDKELESVVGGTVDEINDIIAVFERYGFTEQENKLRNGGVFFFGRTLEGVMKELGYTQQLVISASDEYYNNNALNNGTIGHRKLIEILDEFLYKKSKGIEID